MGIHNEETFIEHQRSLAPKLDLTTRFSVSDVNYVSGIDLSYWDANGKEYAVCCISTVSFKTKELIEIKSCTDRVEIPYIPGCLSFRELPIILKTYKQIAIAPDIAIFDGNGYLHPRHMGIASHASFYLNIPTIGVAKSYFKIGGTEYAPPGNTVGSYEDIVINGEIYGRVLRTRKNIKPIFVSVGNWIDIDTSTEVVLSLIGDESRQPIPTRIADIESRKQRDALKRTL